MNKKIGVFDSGIGGLTVLEKLKEVLPQENFIYYADSINNPYGEKTDEELFAITSNIVDFFVKEDCKLIVIACNTATTRCIKFLRNKYPNLIFVGTEPAIKVACDNNYKNTLVMATPATINSDRTNFLVAENKKPTENIYLASCEGLANAIELKDDEKIDEIVKELSDKYKEKNIDAIVLGCTHYPLIKKQISKYFLNTELIDGNAGVANEVKKQLINHNLLNQNGTKEVIYINSKDI